MLDFVVEELSQSSEWRAILAAYQEAQLQLKKASPEAETWLPRIGRMDGIDAGNLSRLHGKLIALGLLKFELSGKTGVQYQVTPLGRQSLERGLAENAAIQSSAEPVEEVDVPAEPSAQTDPIEASSGVERAA